MPRLLPTIARAIGKTRIYFGFRLTASRLWGGSQVRLHKSCAGLFAARDHLTGTTGCSNAVDLWTLSIDSASKKFTWASMSADTGLPSTLTGACCCVCAIAHLPHVALSLRVVPRALRVWVQHQHCRVRRICQAPGNDCRVISCIYIYILAGSAARTVAWHAVVFFQSCLKTCT
jgi:hypothetical protein